MASADEPADDNDEPASEDTDEPGDDGSSGLDVPLLRPLFSVPANGGALGADLAFSPDGTELAFLSGGIDANVEIYDIASGTLSRSGKWHGQGIEMFWTSDNRLVGYRPDRIYALDATTLDQLEGVESTLGENASDCSATAFSIRYDPATNALFAPGSTDTGTVVCRVDLNAFTTTAALVPDAGGLPVLFLRPDGSELVLGYNAGDQLGEPMAALLDPSTMEVKGTVSVLDGGVKSVTDTDLVVAVDRFTDQLASSGSVLPAPALPGSAGPFIAGNIGEELVFMDASGAPVARGGSWFKPFAVSTDGSTVAVLLDDSLEVYATS